MRNLIDIKLRIKAVSDTRHITKAMETISVAKMRKANQIYKNNYEFFNKIRTTISDIVLHTKDVSHPYLELRPYGRALFIVVASDKGLAGGYNHNVLSLAQREVERFNSPGIFTVGQMAREFFEHRGINVDVEFIHVSNHYSLREASRISDSILNLYDNEIIDEVFIIYTALDQGKAEPTVLKLLPLTRDKFDDLADRELSIEDEEYYKELVYDPSPEEVLAELIPQYLVGIIYGALVQAAASEHQSRRTAMHNATNNATEIIARLQLAYNRARQAAVTNDISEIITGSSLIKK